MQGAFVTPINPCKCTSQSESQDPVHRIRLSHLNVGSVLPELENADSIPLVRSCRRLLALTAVPYRTGQSSMVLCGVRAAISYAKRQCYVERSMSLAVMLQATSVNGCEPQLGPCTIIAESRTRVRKYTILGAGAY